LFLVGPQQQKIGGLLSSTIPTELALLTSLTDLQLGMFKMQARDETLSLATPLRKTTIDTDTDPSPLVSCVYMLAGQNAFLGTIPLELGRLTNLLILDLGR
jgi:hypothetical protein